jgi:hypothetical protein
MTGQNPSRAGGFAIEVETATPTRAAVLRTGTCEWGLGRPREGALFRIKDGERGDDLIESEEAGGSALLLRRWIDGNVIMVILHDRITKGGGRDASTGKQRAAVNSPRAIAYYL